MNTLRRMASGGKRALLGPACVVALTLALFGCGGGNGGGGTTPIVPPPPDPPVSNLPPDPGDAGLATVEGIDSDADGVRDDVQRYIAQEYPDSETVQAALTQIAVAVQDQLLADSSNDALSAATKTMRATECFFAVAPGGSESERMDATQRLQARVINSQMRLDAYRQFDEQLWGEVIESVGPEQGLTSCVFDPADLAD